MMHSKFYEPGSEMHEFYLKEEKSNRNFNLGCASIFLAPILLFVFVGCMTMDRSEPDRTPLPSCVETGTHGCNWAGQKYEKGKSAVDMIKEQRETQFLSERQVQFQ